MAINREKREDLMRDATAYNRRLLLQRAASGEAVFVGFRKQGGWSVYFGEDPVFQFNARGELRRVHVDAQNYAAYDGRLCHLQRDKLGGHVEIQRIYLAATEHQLLADCHHRLIQLAEMIRSNHFDDVQRFPSDDDQLIIDVFESLQAVTSNLRIATLTNA